MPSDVALTVFSAVQWIIEVVSIVGNSLILSFVFSMKRTVRTTNMLTRVSLATSCLIFSLTAFIAHIMWEFDRANFNRTSFYLVCFNIRKCCSVVSYYTIALMAAQRYYAIKFPFKYVHMSKKKHYLNLAAVWIWGCLAFIEYLPSLARIQPNTWKWAFYVYKAIIPFTTAFVFTVLMWQAYFRLTNSGEEVVAHRKSHTKFVKMTAFIVLGYFITCGPYIIVGDLFQLVPYFQENVGPMTRSALMSLFFISSIVDVVVYMLVDDKFQSHIKAVFCHPCRSKNTSANNNSTSNSTVRNATVSYRI